MTRLPDFFVIGAAKSGTTSIHHYLREHPEVFLPGLKEINFFIAGGPDREVFARTIEEYARHYRDAAPFRAAGEVSPRYLPSPVAAERIARHIPRARLVAILRNPVERAWSHYLMGLRLGRADGDPLRALADRSSHYIRHGEYHDDLKRFYDRFDREGIRIFLYDDLKADGAGLMGDLYGFIGVDGSFLPDLSVRHAPGYLPRSRVVEKIFGSRLVRFGIKPRLPQGLLSLGTRIKALNARPPDAMPASVREDLRAWYREDILRTAELTGRDLSPWLAE